MSIARANVTRTIGKNQLQIGPYKNGWQVALVGEGVSIVTGPHRAQIDGVIDVLTRYYEGKSND